MAGRIVYGSPYSKVRGRAFEILQEVNNEYRAKCYHSDIKDRVNFENLSTAIKIIELYEVAILSAGDNFGYISLFMLTQKNECKKALRECVKTLKNHPEMDFNMENVSSLMGTILCNQFGIYSNDHGINYIARIANTDKMIASAKYGVTTNDVANYLKRHRIPFEIFEGCITIK